MAPPDSRASLPPAVEVPEFTGPLDLLLYEVRRQNVALENIAIAPVAARFLEYVGSAAGRNLNLDIEWLHMAATLIHWKSRALLPRDAVEDPHRDPIRDELVQQLLAHRKEAAGELARRRGIEEAQWTRSAAPGAPDAVPEEPGEPGFVSAWDLIQQARELARWAEQQRDDRRGWRQAFGPEPDDVTVREMMDYLRERLATPGVKLDGAGLLASQANASRRSCLFLGMLEMARDQQVELHQDEAFGPIWLGARFTVTR
jgi:segregation and condensation protein A